MASTINASNSGFGGIVSTGDSSGQLQLQTANTTALTIDTSQNVGIGTTSPSAALDVRTGTNPVILAKTTGTGFAAVNIDSSSTATQGYLFFNINGTEVARLTGNASNYLAISTGSSATERMRIDSVGRPLFNTTTPLNAGYMSLLFDGSAYNGFTLKTSYATLGSVYLYFINSAGSVAGFVSQNGTTTVSYTTSSDYRLKENIVPMTGALDKVLQLKPVNYTWKSDGSNGQGFIAHELQAVVPDCVVGEKDAVDEEGNPKYQGVDTSFLVATLTAAIQEQQTIINDLKARIETLEAK